MNDSIKFEIISNSHGLEVNPLNSLSKECHKLWVKNSKLEKNVFNFSLFLMSNDNINYHSIEENFVKIIVELEVSTLKDFSNLVEIF